MEGLGAASQTGRRRQPACGAGGTDGGSARHRPALRAPRTACPGYTIDYGKAGACSLHKAAAQRAGERGAGQALCGSLPQQAACASPRVAQPCSSARGPCPLVGCWVTVMAGWWWVGLPVARAASTSALTPAAIPGYNAFVAPPGRLSEVVHIPSSLLIGETASSNDAQIRTALPPGSTSSGCAS